MIGDLRIGLYLYPCHNCGELYPAFDPEQWHCDPGCCRKCYTRYKFMCTLRRRLQELAPDVVCNQCGASCRKVHLDGFFETYGLVDCVVHGGYLSSNDKNGLDDMTSYTFSLCEKCLGSYSTVSERP